MNPLKTNNPKGRLLTYQQVAENNLIIGETIIIGGDSPERKMIYENNDTG